MREHSKYIKNILTVLAGAFFLASFALYNKFPFIYTDTGTYLASGFDFVVPMDRPIYYGLFLRHVSLHENLWFVVAAQCILISYILSVLSKYIFEVGRREFLGLMIMISFFTGVGLPVGHLIPDVFTPLLILSMCLMISSKVDVKTKYVLSLLIVFSIPMQVSNVALALSFIFMYTVYLYLKKNKYTLLYKLVGTVFIGVLLVPVGHYIIDGSFTFTKKGYLFHVNRLAENGVLEAYLKDECPNKDFVLCEFKENIPGNFLWDYENSPLYKLGGWSSNEEEYRSIVRDIHLSPKYWSRLGQDFFSNGLEQLFNFSLTRDIQGVPGERVNNVIKNYLPHQWRDVKSAYQQSAPERIDKYAQIKDDIFYFLLPLCLIFLLFIWQSLPSEVKEFIAIVGIMIVVNAFVTGGLSTVVPRYQNRVIWLIPFIALSILFPTMRRRAIG